MTMTPEEAVALSPDERPELFFQVCTRDEAERYTVVLSGELDLSTAPLLSDHLRLNADRTWSGFDLDLRDLTFIDSTGLSLIVSEHKRLRANGAQLTVLSPTPMTRRLFEISGLTSLLSIHPEKVGP
jgi:anti-anti-sigma factor